MSMERFKCFKRDGFYHVRDNATGRRTSLKTTLEHEARRIVNKMNKEAYRGRISELDGGSRASVSDFKPVFFEQLDDDLAEDTVAAYDLGYRLLMDFTGKSMLIARVNEKKLKEFRRVCLNRKARKTTINTYLRSIRVILNTAFKNNFIKQKVEIPFYDLGKRHPRILNRKELMRLMRYAYRNNRGMYYFIKFALWTGCRRHEIWTWRWENVEYDRGYCTVIGKGNKERTIILLPMAKSAMGKPKDIGYVFCHYPDVDRHSKEFKKLVRGSGLPADAYEISLHKMRHTAATNLLANGVRLEIVQELLGHADIATTRIYADILKETVKKELSAKVKGFVL